MSVRDKLQSGYYRPKLPYPTRFGKDRPCPSCTGKVWRTDQYCSSCGTALQDEFQRQDDANSAAMKAYNQEASRLEGEFRNDSLKEAGLEGHPKAGKIFAKAWERGHSGGLHEVFSELLDLAELFEDEKKF